jgi:hypothetical protein
MSEVLRTGAAATHNRLVFTKNHLRKEIKTLDGAKPEG